MSGIGRAPGGLDCTAECHGSQASAEAKRLLPPGTMVTLKPEPATDCVDRYGRLLRYVIRHRIAPVDRITFHSLRRTCASLRCACGDDMRYTADELGNKDPRFTLKVYAMASTRRDRLAESHRKAFERALEWAAMGSSLDFSAEMKVAVPAPYRTKPRFP